MPNSGFLKPNLPHFPQIEPVSLDPVSARSAGRRRHDDPAEFDDPEGDAVQDGILARLVDRIMENPAKSGGLFVMVADRCGGGLQCPLPAACPPSRAVVRDPPRAGRASPRVRTTSSVPDPRPRGTPPVEPPTPRIQPAPPPAPVAAKPPIAPTLVADLQKALSERGLYSGKIDGISGTRTRAAISAYEKSQGLPVTGQPTAGILDSIVTASIAQAPAAAPRAPARTGRRRHRRPPHRRPWRARRCPRRSATSPAKASGRRTSPTTSTTSSAYPPPAADAEPATVTRVSVAPEPAAGRRAAGAAGMAAGAGAGSGRRLRCAAHALGPEGAQPDRLRAGAGGRRSGRRAPSPPSAASSSTMACRSPARPATRVIERLVAIGAMAAA